jgi:hypothetical protein
LVGNGAYFDLFLLLSPIARNSPATLGLGSIEIIPNPKSKIRDAGLAQAGVRLDAVARERASLFWVYQ